jgi:phosphatidylglycerol:prolipoprotein diacylglycerol transferase
LFPYVEQPVVHVVGHPIAAFQILVCLAVIVGHEIVVRRASRRGFDREVASSLVAWTIFLGFVGSHVFDIVLYTPERLLENPLQIFAIWGQMSSFGGIFGGMLGAVFVCWRRRLSREQLTTFIDLVAFAFPFAWIFGRAGCALAHDHLGIRSDHWLAVRFPEGPRFDLGLLELLYTFVIAGVFLALDRHSRPTGFFIALFFVLYGPVRFILDTLRTEDARYLGWTPGMYASIAMTLLGVGALVALRRRRIGEPCARASDDR